MNEFFSVLGLALSILKINIYDDLIGKVPQNRKSLNTFLVRGVKRVGAKCKNFKTNLYSTPLNAIFNADSKGVYSCALISII